MSRCQDTAGSVRQRLLQAARTCFLADDYHAVGTRRIAELVLRRDTTSATTPVTPP